MSTWLTPACTRPRRSEAATASEPTCSARGQRGRRRAMQTWKAMWRDGLWDTVNLRVHANGQAFWFAYAALAFIALGQLISLYRADAAKELPLSFTLPWLALNGLGCYIFPTSGFSSVICNASYLVYLGL